MWRKSYWQDSSNLLNILVQRLSLQLSPKEFMNTSMKHRRDMLSKKCPNHVFDDVAQLNMFYSGLRPQTKMLLDVSVGGTMVLKSPEEATTILNLIRKHA